MKFAYALIKAIEILGSVWLFSQAAADSVEVRLNLIGRTATQSSTYLNAYACLAIDGNYDSDYYAGSCAHTNDLGPPSGRSWWRVDLGQPVKVERVVLVNRGNDCGYRMDNFTVGLSNSSTDPVRGSYAICGQYPGAAADGAYLNLLCDPRAASGRYVIVQQSSDESGELAICEFEIYTRQVRKFNGWERLSNQRLMSVGAIVLSKRSALMCVGKCQETVGCDSVNYRQLDKVCEVNFLQPGAICSYLVIENGWDNWVQTYEFI